MNGNGLYEREACKLILFTRNDIENLNCSREVALEEGKYKFYVWTHYGEKGTNISKFYSTSDLSEIILHNKIPHIGNTDYRDAFRGEQEGEVKKKTSEQMVIKNEVTVEMTRPVAKYKFIATDYDLFKEQIKKAEKQKYKSIQNSSEKDAESIILQDYTVVFRYTGFMPCAYNLYANKVADAWTGIYFAGEMMPISDDELELGFDYVFANPGNQASVDVMVEIYNKEGSKISGSPVINVPLSQSKLTIVKGDFLTSKASGGVGIDPGFEGEWNVEIK